MVGAPRQRTAVRADCLSVELARSLDNGQFAEALRAAIAARGLSLDRVQDRLARRGIQLSVATLSYWQSGQRRPERPVSMLALEHLESVLGLPHACLSSLLGPPRPRGRRTRTERLPSLVDVWAAHPEAARLLSGIDSDADAALRRLSQHDRLRVGSDGRPDVVTCRQLMRAERDGPDRWLGMFDWDVPPGFTPIVTNLRNCRLGRVITHPGFSLFAVELLFDRVLRRGETVLIEYDYVRPGPPGEVSREVERFSRRFRQSVREYVLEVCFDPAAVPVQCRQLTTQVGATTPKVVRCLEVGPFRAVHAVGLNFGPGKFGVTWSLT